MILPNQDKCQVILGIMFWGTYVLFGLNDYPIPSGSLTKNQPERRYTLIITDFRRYIQ